MYAIEYYRLESGRCPVKEFIDELSNGIKAKTFASLSLLKEFGNAIREPYSKPMKNGLFELRIRFSNDIARLFYFFVVNNKVVLTNGFIKKQNKTSKKELEKAYKYKTDYERRMRNERS